MTARSPRFEDVSDPDVSDSPISIGPRIPLLKSGSGRTVGRSWKLTVARPVNVGMIALYSPAWLFGRESNCRCGLPFLWGDKTKRQVPPKRSSRTRMTRTRFIAISFQLFTTREPRNGSRPLWEAPDLKHVTTAISHCFLHLEQIHRLGQRFAGCVRNAVRRRVNRGRRGDPRVRRLARTRTRRS